MVNLYDSREMLEMLDLMEPTPLFLTDFCFPMREQSQTEMVDIDIEKGSRKMAPFVSPIVEGYVVQRLGYSTKSIKCPYIKVKMPIRPGDVLNARQAGDVIYNSKITPTSRLMQMIARDLLYLRNIIDKRVEWMSSQMLQAGKITVTGDDVIGGDFEIDFGRDANATVTLTGADLWNAATSVPLENLRTWRSAIKQRSNAYADYLIMGSSALNDFLSHADVLAVLDNRRMSFGNIQPQKRPDGAIYYGNIETWDIYGYDEWSADGAGTLTALVPATGVIVGSSQARMTKHNAAIQDLRSLAVVEYFPKTWQQEDPSQEWLMLQSAPLCCPHQVDSTIFATVTS